MIDVASTAVAAALLRLTGRDRLLVTLLAELRYLTAEQIRQACYSALSADAASRRLTLLRRRRVLDRLGPRAFDDRRVFWGLGPAGRLAAAALGARPAPRPAAAAIGALLVDHLIAVNQVFCDLCGECRAGRLGRFWWRGSQHARVDLGVTHLVPDAVIAVPAPGGRRWMYCLERDRGTTSPEVLAEKCRRYALMYRDAPQRAHDPLWEARAGAWLMVACDDDRRAKLAARIASGAGIERAWCGRADQCAASLAAAAGAAAAAQDAAEADPDGRTFAHAGAVWGVSYATEDAASDRAGRPSALDRCAVATEPA